MSHPTLSIIRNEHASLSAVLRSIALLLGENRRRGAVPDFGVLRAMLFYVDEFAERLHTTPRKASCCFPGCAPAAAPSPACSTAWTPTTAAASRRSAISSTSCSGSR